MSYIDLAIEDGAALLTFNRPSNLNALNTQVLDELEEMLEKLAADAEVRVVMMTGSGDKAFVAGADIKEMVGLDPRGAADFARRGQRVLARIASLPKPVIALVNGYALGGGFELALACDFIYAAENARFAFPETGLGIMPGFGGTQTLTRLVGANVARELIFSGAMIDASRAAELGIVNLVVSSEALMPEAQRIAAKIAANSGVGIEMAKEAIHRGSDMSLAEGVAFEGSLFALLFASADQKEGMSAFVEKRPAQFSKQ